MAQLRRRYDPLTASIRSLLDAAVLTDAGDEDVDAARAAIDTATAALLSNQRSGTLGISITPEGDTIGWGNLADGLRNPLAPPLEIQYDGESRAFLEVDLGPTYEGAPGHLHGGYCALVLDHLLGGLASHGSAQTVAATGTISFRYQRPTRLGRLRVEAEIERTEGRKLFLVGHIADSDGITVTAEGLFIALQR